MLIQAKQYRWTDPGNCYSSPDQSQVYINIPKNASTWTLAFLQSIDWQPNNICVGDSEQIIVALRDPVDRWASGIAEYFYRYHPALTIDVINPHMIDLIFEQVEFDHHTQPQIELLSGVDTDRTTFFAVDRKYSNNIAAYLNRSVDSVGSLPVNSVAENIEKHKLKQFFVELLTKPQYLSRITSYYQNDFDLIKLISFYEPN
jgi:hypothetical protein